MPEASIHPCQRCGACCASYRVAFHWSEAMHPVFEGKTEKLRTHEVTLMHIKENDLPRCVMLEGKLGELVACAIYPHRPSPCREVMASLEDGVTRNMHCDRAREKHAMPLLCLDDWSEWNAK